MKKDLPHVFANKINNKINNNKQVYSSFHDDSKDRDEAKEYNKSEAPSLIGQNINQKLNTIFSSPNYVYKATVKIFFENETVVKKIIGRNKNYLITIDNELIPINEIVDIDYAK